MTQGEGRGGQGGLRALRGLGRFGRFGSLGHRERGGEGRVGLGPLESFGALWRSGGAALLVSSTKIAVSSGVPPGICPVGVGDAPCTFFEVTLLVDCSCGRCMAV